MSTVYYYGATHVFTNREENATVNILPLRGTLNIAQPSAVGSITVGSSGVIISDTVTITTTLSGTSAATAGLVINGVSCSQYAVSDTTTIGILSGAVNIPMLSGSLVIQGTNSLTGTVGGTAAITNSSTSVALSGATTCTNLAATNIICDGVTITSMSVTGSLTCDNLTASGCVNLTRPFYSITGTTADVSLTGGVNTELGSSFWTSGFTTSGAGSTLTSTTTGRISIGETAFYMVTCNFHWTARAAGPCDTFLGIGGVVTYAMGTRQDAADGYATGTVICKLTSGTYISVFVNSADGKTIDGTYILRLTCTKML